MKKSKFFLIIATMFGALVSFLVVFQLLKDHFDDCTEEDLFEDDTDLDFIDENIRRTRVFNKRRKTGKSCAESASGLYSDQTSYQRSCKLKFLRKGCWKRLFSNRLNISFSSSTLK